MTDELFTFQQDHTGENVCQVQTANFPLIFRTDVVKFTWLNGKCNIRDPFH